MPSSPILRIWHFERRIRERYPDATFAVSMGDDPDGIYLMATVDLEDTGEVLDAIMDRLLEVQIDEALPVYVIPIRPLAPIGVATPLASTDVPGSRVRAAG